MLKTFKDYVNSKCYNDIENAIIDYLKDHGDFVCRGLSYSHDYTSCEYDSHEVKSVYIQNHSETKITCTVDVEVTLNCKSVGAGLQPARRTGDKRRTYGRV